MRWYGHVLRQPEDDVLIKAMVHKVGEGVGRVAEVVGCIQPPTVTGN